MDVDPLDTVQIQPMAPEQAFDRGDREVAEMLVIDRVELAVVDQVAHVVHLDHGDAVVLEQRRDSVDESVRVRDVREHVVGMHDIGPAALGDELCRQLTAEELLPRVDAFVPRSRRRPRRRLDPEHLDSGSHVVLQQIAVVARELDHKAHGVELALQDPRRHIVAGVSHECVDHRREVGVVGGE